MRKVVVKAKLYTRTNFIEMFKNINQEFSEPYWQHDRLFVAGNYSYASDQPRLYLRTIAKDGDQNYQYHFILHRHLINSDFDIFHRSTFADYSELAMIIYHLGYDLKNEYARRRQELRLSQNIRIFVDKIEGLSSYYVKAEMLLSDEDDATVAKKDLIQTLIAFDINPRDFTDKTYDQLLEEENKLV